MLLQFFKPENDFKVRKALEEALRTELIGTCCDASIPDDLSAAMDALRGDPDAEALLGVAYAARQCEELLAAGAPGIHFYALNRAPGTRAVLAALRASRPWERASRGAPEQRAASLD